jgi:rhamnogalacturonyl hydrolase YesR
MARFTGFLVSILVLVWAGSANSQSEFNPDTIVAILQHTAQYRMNQDTLNNKWVDGGTYFPGVMAVYKRTKLQMYLDAQTTWAKRYNWQPYGDPLTTNGDNQTCFQTYSEIYLLDSLPANAYMVQPADKNLANMFDKAPQPNKRWGWIDEMYMSPPGMVRVAQATHKTRYVDSMDVYWWNSSNYYFDKTNQLFYRDATFFKTGTFWSRGNGWVFGGMARIIPFLPANFPTRAKHIAQFQAFAAKLATLQQANGLWTSDLLNPAKFPQKETSGSAFFCFGMAWGINNGFLDRATFEPVVRKAWTALVGCLNPNGSLGWVQATGSAPAATVQGFNMPYSEGAFLLAGNEVYQMVRADALAAGRAPTTTPGPAAAELVLGVQGESLAVPAGARSYEVYTLQGRRILVKDLGTGSAPVATVSLSELGNVQGARLVRFLFR